jgi:hypothetical protein
MAADRVSLRVASDGYGYYQASLTAGTLFHSTNLPLTKWFWAIYLAASDKDGISAVRLSKQIEVSWITASASILNSWLSVTPTDLVDPPRQRGCVTRHLAA